MAAMENRELRDRLLRSALKAPGNPTVALTPRQQRILGASKVRVVRKDN